MFGGEEDIRVPETQSINLTCSQLWGQKSTWTTWFVRLRYQILSPWKSVHQKQRVRKETEDKGQRIQFLSHVLCHCSQVYKTVTISEVNKWHNLLISLQYDEWHHFCIRISRNISVTWEVEKIAVIFFFFYLLSESYVVPVSMVSQFNIKPPF